MIYDHMNEKRKQLDEQIQSLQSTLSTFPSGKLICTRNSNRFKWYLSDGHSQKYLPKSQRQLAEQFAYKKYLSSLLNDLTQERKALDLYLHHHEKYVSKTEHLLHPDAGYLELLSAYFKPKSDELTAWMSAPYDHNPKFPEHLTHKSVSGNLVRSKSEAMIDTILYLNHIPFRYECSLQFDDITLYPDFTIRHPKNGDFFYWEHFGLMDDSTYSKNAFSKMQFYSSHGIIPGIHLITTYETQKHPLSSEAIEKITKEYFL